MSEGETMKIAITGTIGGGKSQMSKYLISLGYPVFDTDKLVHTYYDKNGRLEKEVVQHFGTSILDEKGVIDRRKLAKCVFENDKELIFLESLVFPVVSHHVEELYQETQGIVFFEVPMLFESGLDDNFDVIVMVTAQEEIRVSRLVKRGMSKEDIKSRTKRHEAESVKIAKSDYIIYNDGSIEELHQEVDDLLLKLKGA